MGIGRDTATTLSSRVVALAVAFVQSVIIARYLMPEGRGQLATLLLIPQLVVTVLPLGIQWALIYYLRNKEYNPQRIVQNGWGLTLVLSIAGFGATLGIVMALEDTFLAGLSFLALLMGAAVVPVRLMQNSAIGVFRGTDRILHANVLGAARAVLLLGAAIVALVWLAGAVPELVSALVVAESAIVLASGVIIFRRIPPVPRLDPAVCSAMISYGARLYVFSILLFINHRLDMALLRYFVDYQEVGYYVTAVTLAEILWNIPNSLTFVLLPSLVGVSPERREQLTTMASRVTMFVMLGVCLLTGLLAHPVIRLVYGEAYLPSALPLMVILPGILFMALQQVIGSSLAGRGRPQGMALAGVAGIVINFGLNLWLIPRFGAVGAAAASTISYAVVTAIILRLFLRASGAGLGETLLITRADFDAFRARLRGLWKAER